jgi:hypothetical protein
VQLMVRPLNGKRGGPQRHATTGVRASSDRAGSAILPESRKDIGRKKPSGTHKPRFRNTDFRWQDRISVHYRIAVRFYPVS